MTPLTASLVVSAMLGAAIVGGIFFAFSNFVMKALAQLPAREGIAAMQSINVVVLNRGFLATFAGTTLLCVLLAGVALARWSAPASPWLLAGAVSYVVGSWLVTVGGNVPLNQQLASLASDDDAAPQMWAHYLKRWTRLNTQRAGASICSALLLSLALLV